MDAKKNKVSTITLSAVAAAAAMTLTATPAAHAQSGVQVTVNGSPVQFNGQGPVESNGRVLVPLRGVLEKIGAYVNYDAAAKQVTAVRNETQIVLPLNTRTATVGGRAVSLEVPAQVVNGSTLVPLRFVAESLGATVSFEASSNTVAITQGGGTSVAGSSSQPIPNRPAPQDVIQGILGGFDAGNGTLTLRTNAGRRRYDMATNYRLTRKRPGDESVSIRASDLHPGDRVRLELNANNRVRNVILLQEGDGGPGPGTVAGERNVVGIVRDVTNTDGRTYTIVFESGARVDIARSAPVLYQQRNIGWENIKPGDRVSVWTSPEDDRGRRVAILNHGQP